MDENQTIDQDRIKKVNIEVEMKRSYIDYSMSVIVSRALPDVRDGFKPVHRRILYGMLGIGNTSNNPYKKCARVVGEVLGKYHPHGDSAVYDTMVRLSRGYEALLHPYVDSKGNFGKFYSRDMAWAASRYTEARLDPICRELFRDIDKDTVDFVDNYDSTMKEPTLLPAALRPVTAASIASGQLAGSSTPLRRTSGVVTRSVPRA